MARKLEDQINVDAPTVDYPYGRIRDDDGTGNGTPLTEAVHGDYHQFFARLLFQSGLVINELPDNNANGFQLNEALDEIIADADDVLEAALLVEIADLQDQIDDLVTANDGTLRRKVAIGDWNMDSTASVTVDIEAAGIDISKIVSLEVCVRADSDASLPSASYQSLPQMFGVTGVNLTHSAAVVGTGVQIFRTAGTGFDSVDFDATGYNRGWILVTLVP